MKVIYYAPGATADQLVSARVASLVREVVDPWNFSEISSFNILCQGLRTPVYIEAVLVLLVMDMEGLSEFVTIAELLADHKIILIIHEGVESELLLARVHLLRPRFVAMNDSQLAEIGNVITNFKRIKVEGAL